MKNKLIYCFWIALSSTQIAAQVAPQKVITSSFIDEHFDPAMSKKKKIDSTFEMQIRAALLFYPELNNTKIKFRVKKTVVPLQARPRIWAIFQRPKNRQYLVTISNKSSGRLEPILLKNLSFNAQIGVLGHELSHVADFQQRKGLYFVKLLAMHLSIRSMDTFENNTDRRCIAHGLGYQLLAWSVEVRKNLNIEQWGGTNSSGTLARERYMSPESIKKIIDLDYPK